MIDKNVFALVLLLKLQLSVYINGVVGQTDYYYCLKEFECLNEALISGDVWDTLNCDGYGSCSQTIIKNDAKRVYCNGRSSCQNSVSFGGNPEYGGRITGYLGLAFSKTVNMSGSSFICYGEGSCIDIVDVNVPTFDCYGVSSCIDNVNPNNNMKRVNGLAMYSTKNSMFSIANTEDTSNIFMYGYYSGYNMTYVCESGKTCNLKCGVNGCKGLNFICNNRTSVCNVMAQGYEGENCDDINVACPNIYDTINSSYVNSNNDDDNNSYNDTRMDIISVDVGEGYLLSLFDKEYKNDIFGSSSECNISCNDASGSSTQNCSSLIDEYDGDTDTYTLCCNAESSCGSMGINKFKNVKCDAAYGCSGATISNISNFIESRADSGIENGGIFHFNSFLVTSYLGCAGCNISNGYYLGCFGYLSCDNSRVSNVEIIVASGYLSMSDSFISSGGTSTNMSVYLLGHDSGAGLEIMCNFGDLCNIFVYNSAVYNGTKNITCNKCNKVIVNNIATQTVINVLTPTTTHIPTQLPTRIPSVLPSMNPTIFLSITSTAPPTGTPTKFANDTLNSTILSSQFSSQFPSHFPSQFSTQFSTPFGTGNENVNVASSENNNKEELSLINNIARIFGITMIFIFFVLLLMKQFDGVFFYKECDKADYFSVFKYIQSSIDVWSDCLFIYAMYLEDEARYFYLSCIFVITPSLFSIVLVVFWIYRWRVITIPVHQRLTDYLDKYTTAFVVFTIFGTFGGALSLMESQFLLHPMFNFQLKRLENQRLLVWKFVNDTLLEVTCYMLLYVVLC